MPKILIPTPLRQYTGKQDTVQVKGATVGEALADLTGQHQDLRRNIYNDEGKLRSFVNVYLNDEDIRYLNKEATPVKDSDTISIVPSIAGGSALDTMAPPVTLSKDEILRYSRHLIMPEVGMEGQLKLKSAKVLLIGTGGLGAPLGLYLAEGGVLGILPGTIGLIQATETVKLILGIGEPLVGRLLLYDALGMRFRELKLRKNPDCPICGDHRTITQLIDYNQFCGIPAHEP